MRMLDHPKVTVPIYDIVIDSHINTRELDEDVIEEYREAMREYGKEHWQSFWNESPRMTESNHLYSGFHTVTAAMREFGREYEISVVQEGKDWRDAYFLATRMNATHGRRRTNAEKEEAVKRWLEDEEMCQWTDGHIARECLVSAPFVSKRRRLETISSQPTKRKFVDSDGEIQWKETEQIGAEQTKAAQETESESETEGYEYKNAYDFAVAKSDEAIRTYEEKQESLGLSELPWYGADGFFYYAQAEFERQGKQLGYAYHQLSINQLSELAKLWESVTNAIKHNANWVKRVVRQEEQKTERERQEAIEACRKLVKEAKQRFHTVRTDLGFPDLEWEHFISSYAQKQFEDPLFPHVFEHKSLRELKDRCGIWENIKGALSATRPVAWVEEIAQQHNKADVQPNIGQEIAGEAVGLSDTDTIKLTGLRSVLERLHTDGALEEQVGDGTRHAKLYETTPEKVLSLRDLILSESKQEQEGDLEGLRTNIANLLDVGLEPNPPGQSNVFGVTIDIVEREIEQAKARRSDSMVDGEESEQPTALQIEPLGPSDSNSQTEADNAAEVKSFMMLGFTDKARLRTCKGYLKDISEIEGIPDSITTLSEALHKALEEYVE